jgi:hypothetical protein
MLPGWRYEQVARDDGWRHPAKPARLHYVWPVRHIGPNQVIEQGTIVPGLAGQANELLSGPLGRWMR